MPTVPRYNSQVRENSGPNIRQNMNVNPSSFGVGGFQGMSNAIDQLAKIKNDADQIEVTSAFTERSKRIETIKTDPETGFFTKQGRNAIDSYDSAIQSIKDADDEIVQKYNLTGTKLEMFNRLRDRDDIQNQAQLNRHLTGERRRFDDDTQKAFVQTEADSAVKNFKDHDAVNYKLENIEGSIIAYGQRNGLSAEEVNLQRSTVRSGIRAGVVSQYLNNGDDRGAKAYFEQHKDALTAKDSEKLQKDLELGSLRGESQRESDKIFAESPTLGQAIEKVRKIEDPKLRDETMQRVRQNFQMKEAVEQETRENRSSRIATLLEKNSGDIDKIPPSEWNTMSASERSSWRSYSKSLQKGDMQTDWKEYTTLSGMAADPSTRSQFMNIDMFSKRHLLADPEFKEMVKMQREMRENGGSSKVLDGVVTDEQIFNDAVNVMGISKNDEKKAAFRESFNQQVMSKQSQLGRKLNDDEKIKIKNNLISEVVTKKGIFFDSKKNVYELESADKVEDIKVDQIPKSELLKIKASRAYKANPTDAQIKKMYIEVNFGK